MKKTFLSFLFYGIVLTIISMLTGCCCSFDKCPVGADFGNINQMKLKFDKLGFNQIADKCLFEEDKLHLAKKFKDTVDFHFNKTGQFVLANDVPDVSSDNQSFKEVKIIPCLLGNFGDSAKNHAGVFRCRVELLVRFSENNSTRSISLYSEAAEILSIMYRYGKPYPTEQTKYEVETKMRQQEDEVLYKMKT